MVKVLGIIMIVIFLFPMEVRAGMVIDYSKRNMFEQIPSQNLSAAAALKYLQMHMSVGMNIDGGLSCWQGTLQPQNCPGSSSRYDRSKWNWPYYEVLGTGMVGADAERKMSFFESYISNENNRNAYDVLSMKFCYTEVSGSSHPDWNRFNQLMHETVSSYSNKKFIWWTIPLTVDGASGLDTFNNLLRVEARKTDNNIILFDLADIESRGGSCTNGGNNRLCQEYAADGLGHLNWTGKAEISKYIWVMMACVAGWGGCGGGGGTNPTLTPGPSNTPAPTSTTAPPTCLSCPSGLPKNRGNTNCDSTINMLDFATWYAEYQTYRGSGNQLRNNWNSDFNCDQKVDMLDFATWYAGYVGGGT